MAGIGNVHIQLLLPRSPWTWKQELLEAFEKHPVFAPTHWGRNEGLRDPYQREELERFADAEQQEKQPSMPVLRRTARPLYVATWNLDESPPGWVTVGSRMTLNPGDAALFFEFGSHLAGSLPIEFGLVDLSFKDASSELAMNPSGLQHPAAYWSDGPTTLFARTFFGPRLVALMGGREVLQKSGGIVTGLGNGVLALDLLAEPWASDAESLKQKQRSVLERLLPTEVFSREGTLTDRPGRRWIPPPRTDT